MSKVISALDPSLHLVENIGGGDCLLYCFLCAIMHGKDTPKSSTYLSIRKNIASVFRRMVMRNMLEDSQCSLEDINDGVDELCVERAPIVITLVPYMGKKCTLSVIIVETVRDRDIAGVVNTLYTVNVDGANKYIIIYHNELEGHYMLVVRKRVIGYDTLFADDDPLVKKLLTLDFTIITPAKNGNRVLQEDEVMT